ncbi:hypothetical protein ACEQPO_06100 [Bacillus sp. SL00103]
MLEDQIDEAGAPRCHLLTSYRLQGTNAEALDDAITALKTRLFL